jgi:hypothetical protein
MTCGRLLPFEIRDKHLQVGTGFVVERLFPSASQLIIGHSFLPLRMRHIVRPPMTELHFRNCITTPVPVCAGCGGGGGLQQDYRAYSLGLSSVACGEESLR